MESNKLKIDLHAGPSHMIDPLINKHKIMNDKAIKLQAELIKKGYIAMRLWSNESVEVDIDHFEIVGPHDMPRPGDFNIGDIPMGSEEALKVLDHYLNTVKITPNPLTAPKKV